ncbi:N-acetylglucosamine kinase [Flexivirga caeni]|nr:BadF/BadG/BcrA/BcrD ATPase family protein [Flexivirga caeni]
MDLFLTLDAGGTSTRAIVHTADGVALGYGVAGGGNPTASGAEAVARELRTATASALGMAHVSPGQVTQALAAMAGSAVSIAGVEEGLETLGVRAPLQLGSDLEAIFASGTASLDGVALVSGTGAAAVVVQGGTTTARSDGRGWLLGDAGSGYWIARRVIRAVTADLDRRGPRTALTDALLPAAGVVGDRNTDKDVLLDQLVALLYAIPAPGTARFAPLAFDLAGTDHVAARIVDDAGDKLATTVLALHSADRSVPLVAGGSVLFRQEALRTRVAGLLRGSGWSGSMHPVSDGTVGAICMNLRSSGVIVDAAMHPRIVQSLHEIRAPRP